MCTILAAVRVWPGCPLLIAANRDERLERPARGPFVRATRPRVLAPRDELALGTWLGVNELGLFVGVTNRAGAPPDPSRRSRGALVMDALAQPSARAVRAALEAVDPRGHNPFHLLYADAEAALLTVADGERFAHHELPSGLHVLTEQSFGAGPARRAARLGGRAAALVSGPEPGVEAWQALLAEHAERADSPLDGACVHADAFGYGTRSSTVLRFGAAPQALRLFWADGRPCSVALVERAGLVADLVAAPGQP